MGVKGLKQLGALKLGFLHVSDNLMFLGDKRDIILFH